MLYVSTFVLCCLHLLFCFCLTSTTGIKMYVVLVQSIISSHLYNQTYKPSLLIHPWTQTSPNGLFRTAIYLASEKFSENCSGRLSMALKAYQENCWACSMTLAFVRFDCCLACARSDPRLFSCSPAHLHLLGLSRLSTTPS